MTFASMKFICMDTAQKWKVIHKLESMGYYQHSTPLCPAGSNLAVYARDGMSTLPVILASELENMSMDSPDEYGYEFVNALDFLKEDKCTQKIVRYQIVGSPQVVEIDHSKLHPQVQEALGLPDSTPIQLDVQEGCHDIKDEMHDAWQKLMNENNEMHIPPHAKKIGPDTYGWNEPELVRNKYMREIKPGVWVDVYNVIRAFNVTDGALQHLLKKALAVGQRGHKDAEEDYKDILASAERALQIYKEWNE